MSTYTHDYTAEYLSLFKRSGAKIQITNAAVLNKIGAAPASHVDVHASDTDYGHVMASSSLPAALGTAAVGTSLKYARADHVHPLPTNVDAETAKALKNPFMLYLEGAAVAEDRVDGVTDVHLRILKLDAQALEGLINLDNLPIGTESGTIAAGNHTHDYSNVYAALSHTHNYSSVYAALNHRHAITSLTLASAQSDLPGGSTTPATASGWLFLASDNNALYNENPHWARLTPTHIYIADAITGSTGHSIIINEKGSATLSSVGVSQSTNPMVIGMLPSSVSNSDSITPFDLYDYAASVNHNHSGVYAPATHSHTSSDISDLSTVLSTALSGYSQTEHSHSALSAGAGLKYATNGQTYTGEAARTISVDVDDNFNWTGIHSFPATIKINKAGVLIGKGSSSAIDAKAGSANRQFLKYTKNNNDDPGTYGFSTISKDDLPNISSLNSGAIAAGHLLVSASNNGAEWLPVGANGNFLQQTANGLTFSPIRAHTVLQLTSSTTVQFTHTAGTDQTVFLNVAPSSTSTTTFNVKVPSPDSTYAGDRIKFVVLNEHDDTYTPIINFVPNDSNDAWQGDHAYDSDPLPTAQRRISCGEMMILYGVSYTANSTTHTFWRAQKLSETSF